MTRAVQTIAALALLFCMVPPVWAQQADPDAKEAAAALFEEGRQLLERRAFAEAVEKFEAAYQLFPAVGTLLNLGVAHRGNGDVISAWEAFERAADLAARTDDERESYARERMKEITPQLYRLRIEVPEQVRRGLVVTVDGQPLSDTRWNMPFPVKQGEHVVRAERPGAKPFETRVDVNARGEETVVEIPATLPADTVQPTASTSTSTSPLTPAPAPADQGGGMPMGRKIALGGFAVGALGLVAGSVLGLQASGLYDDAEKVCPIDGYMQCDVAARNESQGLRDDARSRANIATVSFVVGLAAGIGGAVLWFTSAPDEATGLESARIMPIVEPGQAGVSVRFGF